MKCPDCNGVIEGRRPFCPHCGRRKAQDKNTALFPPPRTTAEQIGKRERTQSSPVPAARSKVTQPQSPLTPKGNITGGEIPSIARLIQILPASVVRTGLFVIGGTLLSMALFGPSSWLMGTIFGFVISHHIGNMSNKS